MQEPLTKSELITELGNYFKVHSRIPSFLYILYCLDDKDLLGSLEYSYSRCEWVLRLAVEPERFESPRQVLNHIKTLDLLGALQCKRA